MGHSGKTGGNKTDAALDTLDSEYWPRNAFSLMRLGICILGVFYAVTYVAFEVQGYHRIWFSTSLLNAVDDDKPQVDQVVTKPGTSFVNFIIQPQPIRNPARM